MKFHEIKNMTKIIRIGVAGLGTVGSAVVQLFEKYNNISAKDNAYQFIVTAVSAKNKNKKRDFSLNNIKWYDDPIELARSEDIDIFVELIGGAEGVAKESIEQAILANHHIVSANKALLARHGKKLIKDAHQNNLNLKFESAVAGGIPIITMMQESLIANHVSSLYGILNGTSNYILTNMAEQKISFEECLHKAQMLGYAEADPTFDIKGLDTAHKLALLSSIAFDCFVEDLDIYCEGIENIELDDIKAAETLGYKIKLLAIAEKSNLTCKMSVYPALIKENSQLAKVEDVTNAILLRTDLLGDLFLSGPGAGGMATASAILSDIVDITKSKSIDDFRSFFIKDSAKTINKQEVVHPSGYFIRLEVEDKAGVFAKIAQNMAENNISLESIIQRTPFHHRDNCTKMVLLVTHEAKEDSILKIFSLMEKEGYLKTKPKMIRIKHFS